MGTMGWGNGEMGWGWILLKQKSPFHGEMGHHNGEMGMGPHMGNGDGGRDRWGLLKQNIPISP